MKTGELNGNFVTHGNSKENGNFVVGYPKLLASLSLLDEMHGNKYTSGNINENGSKVASPNNLLGFVSLSLLK